MILYFYAIESIVSDLENGLTNITKREFQIKKIDSKSNIAFGTLLWDKSTPIMRFVMNIGGQITTIVNDQKRIVMKVDVHDKKDRIKPKDITDNPLAAIFKRKVQFVEHSDSQLQTKSRDLGHGLYQVILYKFSDPHLKKDHLILEYAKKDSGIALKRWITVTEKKKIVIEFLTN